VTRGVMMTELKLSATVPADKFVLK